MTFSNSFRPNRRAVLAAGIGAAAFGLGGRPAFAAESLPITTAFGWISNVEFAGFWIALDKGYFAAEGVDSKFLPGGPNAPDALVTLVAGSADVASPDWLPFLEAVDKGNDLVILGASWAKSPAALLSLAKRPMREPKDLVGGKFLIQSPNNRQIIDTVLTKAGLPLEYETVPTGFSPEPLLNGDGDGYFCFATNQPITLEKMGMVRDKDFFVTLWDDLGFKVVQGYIVVKREFLEKHRPQVVGYLKALIKGWKDNAADPSLAVRLVTENYGADLGLDPAQQLRQNELQIPLIAANGPNKLLWFDTALVSGTMTDVAKISGRTVPALSKIVDLGPLDEALKAS
ncbi:ABC transporter substrate-binding protein [Kaistia dalseonensis]|uniref:Thiamine pyrimidine synthase n=1 Tax=Kaistia dalseonensis TaxID=410840 RepID=A0ABU0H724_9HYPH|nr:ABC transporter substrate-binding protein [Kaistia dalseonensis]MCX5495521.1 ABC transporter substrate-binding protein [Kaistia dalseonensis]MDQ0438113.1 ABC-type nitrate/sulfonate/bicarbonate transport system substrate-binding protein [Kaistia dalseonensis]